MKMFDSFEKAKITYPTSEIYKSGGLFGTDDMLNPAAKDVEKCHPANHCMTVEEFLKAGHKLAMGDIVLNSGGKVIFMSYDGCLSDFGVLNIGSINEYILRAAALKKTKRVKVEYVKCEFSREWEAVKHYNEVGELFVTDCCGNYTNVNDISGAWYEVVCKNYMDLYRRTETEITERDEFIEEACKVSGAVDNSVIADIIRKLYDSGKFKLVEE
tara:strand:+ start:118 stop:759 length:642 start_codon:yes stop_codon:yes gene_type:complete